MCDPSTTIIHNLPEYKGVVIGIRIGGVVFRALDKHHNRCTYIGPGFYRLQLRKSSNNYSYIDWIQNKYYKTIHYFVEPFHRAFDKN